ARQNVVIAGTAGNDTYYLTLDREHDNTNQSLDGTFLQIYENAPPFVGKPAYTVTLAALGSIFINTLGGDDTITLDFSNGLFIPINGIDVVGGTGNDTLNIVDNSNGPKTYTVTGSTVTIAKLGGAFSQPGTIRYNTSLENLNISAGGGNDLLTVQSTSTATALSFHGNAGSDFMIVQSTAPGPTTLIFGDGNDDTLVLGGGASPLSGLLGPIVFDGGGGADTLSIDDSATATGQTYTLGAGTVTATDAPNPFAFSNVERVAVSGGSGGNDFEIPGASAASTFDIKAGLGNDIINIFDSSSTLNGLVGSVTVNAQGGVDNLNIKCCGVTAELSYAVDYKPTIGPVNTSVQRTGTGIIKYSLIAFMNLDAGQGSDTINVSGAATNTTTTINANGGNDTF